MWVLNTHEVKGKSGYKTCFMGHRMFGNKETFL